MKKSLLSHFVVLIIPMIFSIPITAQDCYKSSIISPTPFMGNDGEIFKLADNTIWEVKYEYEYLYEYYPNIVICPKEGLLIIGDKTLNVKFISSGSESNEKTLKKAVIQSTIISEFNGLEKGNIYKLDNGQIWEQTEAWIWAWIWVNPSVIIWNEDGVFKMKVDQIDHAVIVKHIK